MRRLAPAAALLVGAGCAGTFQAAKGHDQVASLVQERIGAPTGWSEGDPGAEPIAARVDALLAGGLTQVSAVQIALVNNPSLQATYEELGVSQADLIQAGLLKNPSLDLSFGLPLPGVDAVTELEGALVQDFVDLFMLPLRQKVAAQQFLADVLRVAHEALATAAEVKQAVVELEEQEQALAVQRMILQTAEAAADLAERQRQAGNITDLALASRRVAFQQAKVEVSQAELAIAAQRERLDRLLGLWGPRTAWKLREPLPDLPAAEQPLEHLESLAVQQRLDIAAAKEDASLRARAVEVARTFRWFGRVEIGPHGHQDANRPKLVGVSLSLELPLFDQRQGLIARLEAEQRQSERKLAALSVNARSEVRESQARLTSARALALHLRDAVLPLRAQVVQQSQLQYNGMQLGLYDLLEARREELESRRQYLQALRSYWDARIDLERLVGGRLPSGGVKEASR